MLGNFIAYNRWAFLEVEHDLGRYLRQLFLRRYGIKLQRPSNKEHITVISPEDSVDFVRLREYNGKRFDFELIWILEWNGNAVWMPILSQSLSDLRKEFGLGAPIKPLHFCIGYLRENNDGCNYY